MPKLVIDDIDDGLMNDLVSLAASNEVPVEVQAKQLLRQFLPTRDRKRLAELADAVARRTLKGVQQVDSVNLLREDRQR